MRTMTRWLVLGFLTAATASRGAGWLDFLGLGKASTNPPAPAVVALSNPQIVSGLKEALGQGIRQAVAILGQPDGFLQDASVRIPMPASLTRVEKTLRSLRQDQLADEFITTLNRAAEKAVPEAAAVLGDSLQQMTLADAQSILTASNTAATAYFRRTGETNLFSRLYPIVSKATSQTGVTSSYKQMINKVGFAATLLGQEAGDLDAYVTRKALDGLFLKIAAEEQRIRLNPAARATELLRKVFGSLPK